MIKKYIKDLRQKEKMKKILKNEEMKINSGFYKLNAVQERKKIEKE